MEKPVFVVLNPSSGRGQGGKARDQITSALRTAGVTFELTETKATGDAITLARQARLAGYETVIAAGGDGTVSEVVNGLAQATAADGLVGKLAILPAGSGNDFADMTGIARDLGAAARAIAVGHTRRYDLGHARITHAGQIIERYFANSVGAGFEAQVTIESNKIKRLRGVAIYIVAAVRALLRYQTPHVQLTWTDQAGIQQERNSPVLLVSVGNSPRSGGGFYLTPTAKLDDGLLDLGVADALPRGRVLLLLPKALQGKHVSDPAFSLSQAQTVQIVSRDELPVHLDGEVISHNADRIELTLQPARLQVIV